MGLCMCVCACACVCVCVRVRVCVDIDMTAPRPRYRCKASYEAEEWTLTLRVEYAERGKEYDILFIFSLVSECSNLEYEHVPVEYRVHRAEYVIHTLVAAPQEYVNIYLTRRTLPPAGLWQLPRLGADGGRVPGTPDVRPLLLPLPQRRGGHRRLRPHGLLHHLSLSHHDRERVLRKAEPGGAAT